MIAEALPRVVVKELSTTHAAFSMTLTDWAGSIKRDAVGSCIRHTAIAMLIRKRSPYREAQRARRAVRTNRKRRRGWA
jgi:hypothetical protein